MLGLYARAAALLAWISAPIYRLTLGRRPGSPPRSERMGHIASVRPGAIWFHSVSMGEAGVARSLMARLRADGCRAPFLWTATTPAGLAAARSAAANLGDVQVRTFPLDTTGAVRRFLDRTQPGGLVLVETEIWPVLLAETRRRAIPVTLANGRISDRAFPRFRRWSALYRPAFAGLRHVAARSQEDAQRFLALGCDPERVEVCGDVKWDREISAAERGALAEIRAKYGISEGERLIVAGSTRPGEERHVLRACIPLMNRMPNVRLVIAPRHAERGSELAELVRGEAVVAARASVYVSPVRWQILVLDTLGELMGMYGAAAVSIIGGTWERFGGHNPVEPLAWGCPLIAGPFGENFREVLDTGAKRGALVRLAGHEELQEALQLLLTDERVRVELAARAAGLIREMSGATARACAMIRTFLEGTQDATSIRTGG